MPSAFGISPITNRCQTVDNVSVDDYGQLRRLARACMLSEHIGHTLQPTALLHEALLRLAGDNARHWDSATLLAAATNTMRRILIDHARRKCAFKRGGDMSRVPMDEYVQHYQDRGVDLLALDEALEQLDEHDAQLARLVELRFFAGFTMPEIARHFNLPLRTVERQWQFTRVWLHRALSNEDDTA